MVYRYLMEHVAFESNLHGYSMQRLTPISQAIFLMDVFEFEITVQLR